MMFNVASTSVALDQFMIYDWLKFQIFFFSQKIITRQEFIVKSLHFIYVLEFQDGRY